MSGISRRGARKVDQRPQAREGINLGHRTGDIVERAVGRRMPRT